MSDHRIAIPDYEIKRILKREYIETRKPFKPVRGCQYRLASDYPADYICTWVDPDTDEADMMNIASKWTMHCHGLGMYVDKRIDWDYSTGGHFNA